MPFEKGSGTKSRGKRPGGSFDTGRQKPGGYQGNERKPTGGHSFSSAKPRPNDAQSAMKREKPRGEQPLPHADRKSQSLPHADRKSQSLPHADRKPQPLPYADRKSQSLPYADRKAQPHAPIPVGQRPFARPTVRPAPLYGERLPEPPPENLLVGRNPVREAIKSGRDIEKLMIAKGELSGSAREIVALARDASIVVQTVDRVHLNELAPNHQGMIAIASAFRYADVEDIFEKAEQKNEPPLIVVLDGITDPHNVGAIIRNAECAGAHGVVIQNRRAAGLTPAAVKASAGAVEHLPVARVTNISKFLEMLKARGIWVTAADMAGEPYATADLTGPLALVIGAEGEGISRLVLSGCDRRVALPVHGRIDSLNASVACGILLYEIRRQRG